MVGWSPRIGCRGGVPGRPAYRISGALMLNNCSAQGTRKMNLNTPALPSLGTMDVDEFIAFLETRPDGEHWELIEGVAVMMAPSSYAHQRANRSRFRAA